MNHHSNVLSLKKLMKSVLSKLIANKFLMRNLFNRSIPTLFLYAKVSMLLSVVAWVLSTAKSVQFDRSDKFGSSFIHQRNNRCPKILRCGAPTVLLFSVEFEPFKDANCFLSGPYNSSAIYPSQSVKLHFIKN